jgi:DNA replication protein DnaC
MSLTTLTDSVDDIRKKAIARGHYKPMTDDEYRLAVAEVFAKSMQAEQARIKPDYSRIGLTEGETSLTWTAIKPNVSDGAKALDAVRPAYQRGFGMVFLWGNWGQGKTLIGKILAATGYRDGKRAAYANMSSVLNDIRLAFDEKENKTTELLRRMDWWMEREVLFLDELDKANGTQWAQEQIFTLLDRRYQMAVREEALTVIASNSNTDELDGYLQSRLYDRRISQVVHLSGKDARAIVPDGWKY